LNLGTKAKRKYCEEILEKISHEVELPQECKDYPVVMAMLRKRRSDHNQGSGNDRTDYAIAFDGMIPSEAQAAMAARKNGHLNPCQIKKRMTNRGSTRVW